MNCPWTEKICFALNSSPNEQHKSWYTIYAIDQIKWKQTASAGTQCLISTLEQCPTFKILFMDVFFFSFSVEAWRHYVCWPHRLQGNCSWAWSGEKEPPLCPLSHLHSLTFSQHSQSEVWDCARSHCDRNLNLLALLFSRAWPPSPHNSVSAQRLLNGFCPGSSTDSERDKDCGWKCLNFEGQLFTLTGCKRRNEGKQRQVAWVNIIIAFFFW